MLFKDLVLAEIESGLFEHELASIDADEASKVFFFFNYFNEELDIEFKQSPNALWKIDKDRRSISGLMPLTKTELFCYLLYSHNLTSYPEVKIEDILTMIENYLKNHFLNYLHDDFCKFKSSRNFGVN